MTWLIENPWPLMILFGTAAVVSLLSGASRSIRFTSVFLALAIVVYLVDMLVESPGEQVEAEIAALLQDFKDEDLDRIKLKLSDRHPELYDTAVAGLQLIDLDSEFHLGGVETETVSETEVIAQVRANGRVSFQGGSRHVVSRWTLTWEKTGDEWILSKVIRRDPINGEEIQILARQ